MTPLQIAETLHTRAFAPSTCRDPRSEPYKRGALHALQNLILDSHTRACPYAAGTAEFDAYFAGSREGAALWYEAGKPNTGDAASIRFAALALQTPQAEAHG